MLRFISFNLFILLCICIVPPLFTFLGLCPNYMTSSIVDGQIYKKGKEFSTGQADLLESLNACKTILSKGKFCLFI